MVFMVVTGHHGGLWDYVAVGVFVVPTTSMEKQFKSVDSTISTIIIKVTKSRKVLS